MPAPHDLTGRTFGYLTAIRPVKRPGKKTRFWECLCVCGTLHQVNPTYLLNEEIKSCGCKRGELIASAQTIHGHSKRGVPTPEYISWSAMKQRCLNPNAEKYPSYGERGISICSEWLIFENFLRDMKLKPTPKHTLERMNRNSNYQPENVVWANKHQQANNRSSNRIINFAGQQKTIAQWAKHVGLSRAALQSRLDRNWPIELAMDPKAQRRQSRTRARP